MTRGRTLRCAALIASLSLLTACSAPAVAGSSTGEGGGFSQYQSDRESSYDGGGDTEAYLAALQEYSDVQKIDVILDYSEADLIDMGKEACEQYGLGRTRTQIRADLLAASDEAMSGPDTMAVVYSARATLCPQYR